MARVNFDAIKNSQYAAVHNWELNMLKIPEGLVGEPEAENLVGTNGKINLFCESTTLPESPITMAEAKIRGNKIIQPLQREPAGTIDLVFFNPDNHSISRFYEKWMELCVGKKSGAQAKAVYCMLNDGFHLHLMNGENTVTDIYKLLKVAPSNVTLGELTGEADLQRVTVTLSYATFEEEVPS